MTDSKLWKQRIIPAFDKMYKMSKCAVPELEGITFSWDDMEKYSVVVKDPYSLVTTRFIPYASFYLPDNQFKKIADESTKGLRSRWYWDIRSEIHKIHYTLEDAYKARPKLGDYNSKSEFEFAVLQWRRIYDEPLFEEYLKEQKAIDAALESKEIDRSQYNKKEAELAKKYGMVRRSKQAESIRATLSLSCSPNCNEVSYKEPWEKVKDLERGKTFEEVFKLTKDTNAASIYCFYWNWKKEKGE